MPKIKVQQGICQLTLEQGIFVKSHIMPKALTRAEGLGPGLVQVGYGKTQRRWSSWYDPKLVTAEGEKILSIIDDQGIKILRKHQLIWSGWGATMSLTDFDPFPGTPWGSRWVNFENMQEAKQLRLFFLSLLWRASATSLPEFSEIALSKRDLEALRNLIFSQNTEPLGFFPVSLTQLRTIGLRHNLTPLAMGKEIPSLSESGSRTEPIYRFYIDGLIIHFSRLSVQENASLSLDKFHAGNDSNLLVSTVETENSAEMENLEIIGIEGRLGRPLFEIERGPFSTTKIPAHNTDQSN